MNVHEFLSDLKELRNARRKKDKMIAFYVDKRERLENYVFKNKLGVTILYDIENEMRESIISEHLKYEYEKEKFKNRWKAWWVF